MRALILGGTGDANQLADRLVREKIDAVYSYAGRTQIPLGHSLPTRIGGFGGVAGLADFIRAGTHHACDRCDASFRRRDEPACGRGLRRDRHSVAGAGTRAVGLRRGR